MEAPLPPEAAAPDQDQGGDQFASLVTNLADGLTTLSQLAAQVDPAAGQAFDQLNQQYQALVDQLSQSMGGGQAPAGQGVAGPEQGTSGAVLVGPTR